MNEQEQIEWLRRALIQALDAMQQAECDLSITPVEMTAEQYEDMTLRVADAIGDVAASIGQLGEIAGFDLRGKLHGIDPAFPGVAKRSRGTPRLKLGA